MFSQMTSLKSPIKPNPYVEIVQLPDNISRKTDVRKNTLNPRWGLDPEQVQQQLIMNGPGVVGQAQAQAAAVASVPAGGSTGSTGSSPAGPVAPAPESSSNSSSSEAFTL